MESHRQHSQTVTPESPKNSIEISTKLSPELEALEAFARKKYASYRGLAERADNAQEVYDPLATNFLHASHLIVRAVLRSAQRESEGV